MARLILRSQRREVLERMLEIAPRPSFVALLEIGRGVEVRPAQELFQNLSSRGPEHFVRDPGVLAANLRFIFLEPRWWRAQDGQVRVDENLGIDADRCRGVACEHDEIVDPLCARSVAAQFSRGGTGPLGALLLVVVTPSVVDRIVEPETDTHFGRMFRERDDVLDLLEALRQMLLRVVVAMRLGISKQNVAIEAVGVRGIGEPRRAPRLWPPSGGGPKIPPPPRCGDVLTAHPRAR